MHIKRVIELDRERVKEIFESATESSTPLLAIYRMVLPEWDEIATLEGWPEVNKATWLKIATMFQKLDQKYHPEALPGWLWMNKGFSTSNEELEDWVALVDCEATLE